MNNDETMYDVLTAAVSVMLIGICLYSLYYFITYGIHVSNFPYDWEPSDGDNLSLVARVLHHLPLYSDWNKGAIINIYNPVYYYLAALLSFVFGFNMQLGRWISFVSVLGVFVTVFLSLRAGKNKINTFVALALTLSLVLLKNGMLIEELHFSVNALYALFGALSIYFMQAFVDKRKTIYSDLSAVMAFLALFTKQQAIAVVITVILALAVRERNFKFWFRYALIFTVLSVVSCLYLEITNNFNFMNSTFFYLREMMPDNFSLGKLRLANFFMEEGIVTLVSALALLYNIFIKRKISVWNIFVIVSIPILCYLMGNSYGGLNYMFPLWIAMVVCSGQFILDLLELKINIPPAAAFNNVDAPGGIMPPAVFSKRQLFLSGAAKGSAIALLSCMMFYGISAASITVPLCKKFNNRLEPARYVMKLYYSTLSRMYAETPNKHFLGNRTIGVFILNNGISEYENGTFATYAWPINYRIDKNVLLRQFDNKYFGIITTGLDPFPEDMMAGIRKNYILADTVPANCWMGRIRPVEVYVPRKQTEKQTGGVHLK